LYAEIVERDADRTQWVVRVRTNIRFSPTHGARVVTVDHFDDHTEYVTVVGEDGDDSALTDDE